MFTLALDIDDLLAQSPGQPQATVAPGTSIGHVHLKVADVPRAFGFYHDALGLQEQAQLPSAAFLSAGGYHHHIGLNSWQSAGASPPADDAPRLRAIEFELGGGDALAELRQRVAGAATDGAERPTTSSHDAGGVSVEDPDGNLLSFAAPSS
jgi:catechol 2,3-dioxygenase